MTRRTGEHRPYEPGRLTLTPEAFLPLTAPASHLDALRTAAAVVDDRRVLALGRGRRLRAAPPHPRRPGRRGARPHARPPRTIADLTGLGPRRGPARELAAKLGPDDLGVLLATPPDDLRAQAGALEPAVTEALAELVDGCRSRWRVAVSWGPATDELAGERS